MRTIKHMAVALAGLSLIVGVTGCTNIPPSDHSAARDLGEVPAAGNTFIVRGLTTENQYDAMPSITYDYIKYVKFTPDAATQGFIREATHNKHSNLIEYVEKVHPSPEGWNLIAVSPINDAVDLGSREYSLLFERTP